MAFMDLEKKQADMRRRVARRAKIARIARAAKRAPVPRERREFEILQALYYYTNHTASFENLRYSSQSRPFGRGWWAKTFSDLDEDGTMLEWIQIRGRDLLRLTKKGQAFVINQLDSAFTHI